MFVSSLAGVSHLGVVAAVTLLVLVATFAVPLVAAAFVVLRTRDADRAHRARLLCDRLIDGLLDLLGRGGRR